MNSLLRSILVAVGFTLLVSTLSSCDKDYPKMEVVKDCTGSYLRTKSGLDYYVCDFASLDPYANGTKIKVKYDVLNQCFGLIETPTCLMEHTYEGVIDILDIKD